MPAVAQNPPPAWPAKDSPEYHERIAKMRAGWQKKRQAAQQAQREAKRAAPTIEPDLIDTGEPEAVRMAPEEREEPKPKGGGKAKAKAGDFDEPTLREYLSLAVNGLATLQGHEHWARSDQELQYVTVPGTRCLNRLDKRMREKLQAMSDPAALVFGVVMIFGPSVLKELEHVGKKQQTVLPGRQQPAATSHYAAPQREAGEGLAGVAFADPRPVSTNGAAAPAPAPDLPPNGTGW